jgi:CRP-like cAMP-binding protein
MLSNWVYCLVFSAIVATTMAEDSSDYIKRIEKLFKDSRSKNYPKNQLIHYQGDPLSQIYFVKKGYIKAYTILDSGDTRTILLLSPGDIFPLSFSASMDWEEYKIRYFYQSLTEVKPGVYRLQIKLSHQEIADLSGVTRETTTTLIKELEKNKIIDQSHGNWIINTKNLEKLTVV